MVAFACSRRRMAIAMISIAIAISSGAVYLQLPLIVYRVDSNISEANLRENHKEEMEELHTELSKQMNDATSKAGTDDKSGVVNSNMLLRVQELASSDSNSIDSLRAEELKSKRLVNLENVKGTLDKSSKQLFEKNTSVAKKVVTQNKTPHIEQDYNCMDSPCAQDEEEGAIVTTPESVQTTPTLNENTKKTTFKARATDSEKREMEWMQWDKNEHSKLLQYIRLPTFGGTLNVSGDLYGDILLPPRLSLNLKLKQGVLFSGVGSIQDAKEQMAPMVEYLRNTLQIPDSKERAARRQKGDYSNGCGQGFALVTSKKFLKGPLFTFIPFFDAVYTETDLPDYPPGWLASIQRSKGSKTYAKAVKVHAMSASPFDVTVMMDFDSYPCRPDFVNPLAKLLNGSDIGITNRLNEMEAIQDYRHWLAEHNSALVVLNMESVRTRILMGLYVEAFHGIYKSVNTKPGAVLFKSQKDQPALMVAMRALVDPYPGEPDNQWATDLRKQHELDSLDHVDFPSSVVCRVKTSKKDNYCGKGSTCLVSHKGEAVSTVPAVEGSAPPRGDDKNFKIFGIGFKKTSTTSLYYMYEYVKKYKGGKNSRSIPGLVNSITYRNDTSLALELAAREQYFQDAPWCNEPQRLYRTLAVRYPKAKFVLTVRDPDQWFSSVTRWTACRPGERQHRCGDVKLSHYANIFNAKSTSREDMIAAFESHNSAIRDYFYQELKQPSRLLEMDFADPKWNDGAGWSLFCGFVGLTVDQCPTGNLPHRNKTPATK
jgi:hypothetical protein